MAYGYYNPYSTQFPQINNNYNSLPQNAQNGANNGILWVQGESGAKSYLVGAGQSVLLMDSEESKFYIKSADVSGMPMPLRKFNYYEETETAVTNTEYVTREEFETKIAELTSKKPKKEAKENE